MATAEQRRLKEIADAVMLTAAFDELLVRRPATEDEFLVRVANDCNRAAIALSVRILELREKCKTGKIEQQTFQSAMMNLSEWFNTRDGDLWQRYCAWLNNYICPPFNVLEDIITCLSAYPHQQMCPELALEATEETPALARATLIGGTTPVKESRLAGGVHFNYSVSVDEGTNFSFSGGTTEVLELCTNSAIKLREQEEKSRQADRDHELKRLDHLLAMAKLQQQQQPRQDSPQQDSPLQDSSRQDELQLECKPLTHELEMAKQQQQPSTLPQDLSRRFGGDVTPVEASRKRGPPSYPESQKRTKLDAGGKHLGGGEDGKPESGPGASEATSGKRVQPMRKAKKTRC
jgi:hypothetical protein